MALSTFADFCSAMEAITITGVTEKLAYPPASLENVGFPVQWLQLPQMTSTPLSLMGMAPTYQGQLVVAIGPVAQSDRHVNWDAVKAMVDTAQTAFVSFRPKLTSWTARPAVVTVGQVDYWAVIVDVITGSK